METFRFQVEDLKFANYKVIKLFYFGVFYGVLAKRHLLIFVLRKIAFYEHVEVVGVLRETVVRGLIAAILMQAYDSLHVLLNNHLPQLIILSLLRISTSYNQPKGFLRQIRVDFIKRCFDEVGLADVYWICKSGCFVAIFVLTAELAQCMVLQRYVLDAHVEHLLLVLGLLIVYELGALFDGSVGHVLVWLLLGERACCVDWDVVFRIFVGETAEGRRFAVGVATLDSKLLEQSRQGSLRGQSGSAGLHLFIFKIIK